MTITIETSGIQETEQLLQVLKSMNIKGVSITEEPSKREPVITKGDKKLNPRELFGLWQGSARSLDQIRATAWKRNLDV